MSDKVKTTVIQDVTENTITFQFKFDGVDLMPIELSESDVMAIKNSIANNEPLRLIRILTTVIERLEGKTTGELNGKNPIEPR